ncbi:MAG TPA: hypothetical protein VLA96_08600 [Terriglobales bacterium]|nr:hypothetical protein [Terriglobales bacterium]
MISTFNPIWLIIPLVVGLVFVWLWPRGRPSRGDWPPLLPGRRRRGRDDKPK